MEFPEHTKKRIITELPAQTEKQRGAAIRQEELPECAANPDVPCTIGVTDFMLKGYDDKHRCMRCNELHVELVMKEAGESAPNTEPKFVAPKLDARADTERAARIQALNAKLAAAGVVGEDTESSPRPLQPGEIADMRGADEHGTRARGISDDERRARIVAKYAKKKDGGPLVR